MLRNLFSKTVYERRRSLVWWALGIAALIVIQILFYPTIRNNNEITKLLESYPKELLAAFGITDVSALTSPTGYLQSRIFAFMLPLLILIFAIGIGTRAIAGEEEARTIDLLLSQPVRRSQVVLQSFAALVVLVAIIGVVLWISLVVGAFSVGMDIGLDKLAAATISNGLLGLFFGTLALALGAWSGKRGLCMGVSATVAVVAYLVNSLAPSVSWLQPAQKLSPFYYATSSEPLVHGLAAGHMLVLLVGTGLLVTAAILTFERRDVAV